MKYLIPLILLFPSLVLASNIIGTVTVNNKGLPTTTPIENIDVQFFDGVNAQLLSTSITGSTGFYNSGNIPDGNYRVRFSDPGAHTPGFYRPRFSGVGNVDNFCSASVFDVVSDSITEVNTSMSFSPPALVVVRGFIFQGTVVDANTMLPIEGVIVEFKNGVNGLGINSITTDINGSYSARFELRVYDLVRIRFFDPSGKYFPEYAGTNPRSDDFCLSVSFLDGVINIVDESLTIIPTGQQVQGLIDEIDDFNLPHNVSTPLNTPLIQAVDLLTDDNQMNDNAVCNKISAFVSRVKIQEKNGRLSTKEADALILSAKTLVTELGC